MFCPAEIEASDLGFSLSQHIPDNFHHESVLYTVKRDFSWLVTMKLHQLTETYTKEQDSGFTKGLAFKSEDEVFSYHVSWHLFGGS